MEMAPEYGVTGATTDQPARIRLADWAGETYLRQCQSAGATIYRYMPNMFHGKLMTGCKRSFNCFTVSFGYTLNS